MVYLRAGTFPGPGDGVPGVGIADSDGLHRHAGVEAARLERNQAGTVRACPFREY